MRTSRSRQAPWSGQSTRSLSMRQIVSKFETRGARIHDIGARKGSALHRLSPTTIAHPGAAPFSLALLSEPAASLTAPPPSAEGRTARLLKCRDTRLGRSASIEEPESAARLGMAQRGRSADTASCAENSRNTGSNESPNAVQCVTPRARPSCLVRAEDPDQRTRSPGTVVGRRRGFFRLHHRPLALGLDDPWVLHGGVAAQKVGGKNEIFRVIARSGAPP